MLGIFLSLIATALSLLVVDIIFPGVDLANFPAAIIAAIAIGFVNALIKPVLNFFSIPLNFLSLGAFSLVINGFCFWLASLFVPGFSVSGLLSFFVAPILLSLVNTLLMNYLGEKYPSLAPMQNQQLTPSQDQPK